MDANDEWLKYALWWSVPLALVGLYALVTSIFKLVKAMRDSRICRVPLTAESVLDITRAGKLNLCLEIPIFTFLPGSGLDYELFDEGQGGQRVELKTAWLKGQTNSGAAVTFPVRVFHIGAPGKFRLKVSGFKPKTDYSRYFVVVSSPINLKSTLYVFAMLFAAVMTVGGFVLSLIAAGANR